MNQELHQPVYSAAIDLARVDLREITDLIAQLRVRQEQLCSAIEAMEFIVSSPAEVRPGAKPVYDISAKTFQPAQNSQHQADPKTRNPIEHQVNETMRVKALA
jgi:hypothetical protein